MQKLVWALVVLLIILHQDNWFWEDDTLILGFMPIGLAYHAAISIAASITWLMAVKFCWPVDDDTVQRQGPHAQETSA